MTLNKLLRILQRVNKISIGGSSSWLSVCSRCQSGSGLAFDLGRNTIGFRRNYSGIRPGVTTTGLLNQRLNSFKNGGQRSYSQRKGAVTDEWKDDDDADYRADVDDDEIARAPDGTKVTRFNKKWNTKKVKKRKEIKVIDYKDIRDSTLEEILSVFPQVAEMDRDEVRLAIANGALYGFSPTKIAKILSRYPEFIHSYHTLLPESARNWRVIFSEKERVLLFHRYPPLMNISYNVIAKGYGFLSLYFSQKELILFLKNNPTQIAADEGLLKEKLELLWKGYSHRTLDIAKSEAATRDLTHILVRHEVLIRAGLLKIIPFHRFLKKEAEEERRRISLEREKYFPPALIVCSSDEKFLEKCTGNQLSAFELEVFQEIIKAEEESKLREWVEEREENGGNEELEDEQEEEEQRDDDQEGAFMKTDYTHPRFYVNSSSPAIFGEKDSLDFYF